MSRPDIDTYFLQMARLISTRGSCVRRKTGCVLVNYRYHVIATGYNGKWAGSPNCEPKTPCPGANYASGEGLDKCQAIHAEANALLQCPNVHEIYAAYCTTSLCIHCVKLLMNTSCRKVFFIDEYPHTEPKQLWINSDREWHHMPNIALPELYNVVV